jgi:hypothetical protein
MSGKVLSTSGRALRGADISVSAKDPEHPAVRFTRSDGDGGYRVTVARSTFGYLVTARMTGYKMAFVNIPAPATDMRLRMPDLRLEPTAQELPTVSVVAGRRPASREIGGVRSLPGVSQSIFSANSLESGDAGDPMMALGGVSGLTVTSDVSGALSFSFAGLGSEQNRIMMNGAEFAGTPPREGFALKVTTSSYDPAVASSGANAEYMFTAGGRTTLHLTVDSPALQFTTPLGDRLGRRQSSPIVSGLFSGSRAQANPAQESGGHWLPWRFTTAYEVRRTSRALTTLGSADAEALTEFRISTDSAQRLLTALPALGIGTHAIGGAEQVTNAVTSFTRLDFTSNSGSGCFAMLSVVRPLCFWGSGETERTTYLVVGGTWRDSRGIGVGPMSLSTSANESRAEDGYVQLVNSMYFGGTAVANDTRSTIGFARNNTGPTSGLPAAAVLLASGAGDGEPYYASVNAAGSGGARTESRNWSWQTKNETNWFTVDGRHELKVAVEGTIDHFTRSHDASLGRFSFNTLGDFLAGTPASFSRSLAQGSTSVTGVHAGVGIGDLFAARSGFNIQYGVRAEHHAFDAGGVRNTEVESAFARRTDRIPSILTVSPMVGFTWNYKDFTGPWADWSRTLMGGIRDYAGLLPTQGFQPFASETGLSTGARDLYCIGSATPTPAWASYQASSASIPDQCTDGSNAAFTQRTPSVSVLSPDFGAAHAWRADLQWIGQLGRTVSLSFATRGALNVGQRSLVDLNFNGVQRFRLPEEGGRPVYVSAASVVPGTGTLSTVESRVQPQFARVSEVGSSFRSQSASLTGTLDYHPIDSPGTSAFQRPVTLSYTLSDARGTSNGFSGTTGGDPRTSTMSAGLAARHVILLSTVLHRADIISVNATLRLQSGTPYTPRVSGDINGDGLRNDRAFVFDPSTTTDAAASGMSRLLASAPASVVRCLNSQVGTIARENSCVGPWTATLNANATLPPDLFRLQNRGRVTLKLVNVMAGVDQLLHGADGMRGWGQYSFVDPTLLTVRGFDPAKQRFLYTVNPEFGSGRAFRSASLAPFRIILDVTLDLGADVERTAMVRFLTPRAAQGFVPFDSASLFRRFLRQNHGMFDLVLDVQDSLHLTPFQRDSIIAMNLRYSAFRDSVAGVFAAYLVAQGSNFDRPEVQDRWHRTFGEVMEVQMRKATALYEMLTKAQWEYLNDNRASFDERPYLKRTNDAEIERMLRRWKTYFP